MAGTRKPTRNRRTPADAGHPLAQAWRWRVFGLLLPAQLVGVALWRQPVLDPLTVTASILDKALLVASTVGALAAVAMLLVHKQKWAFRLGQLAALAAAATSVSVLAAGVRPPRDAPVLVLAAAGAVGAGVGGYWLWTRQPTGARVTPSALVASTVAGALLPLLQLWSATSFVVGAQHVALSATSDVSVLAADPAGPGALDHVRVATTFSNASGVRARVIVTQTLVCWWAPGELVEYDPTTLRDEHPDRCTTWRPLEKLSWVDGDADLSDVRVVDIPADHPHVVLQVRTAYARGDRFTVDPEPTHLDALDACRDVELYRIREESRFRSVAQQDKFLMYADDDGDGGLNFHLTSAGEMSCPTTQLGLQDYYAITTSRVITETWLTAPPTPGSP
ncbi:hypothetical protein [Cellulomonas edaphi]|uniref:Uncharacterized protein n=1 Tax=Cellulomonas edaphi TaxID=3053468 RepID=A0ABT7S7N4_9CELL|nr:hypothetical protein [Cellulomons edaphi]MDM7831627.1 hypothetical protein [Cellulomons edaphi]